ncbi:MAG TPA: TRAP transporter substrate-binding protein [Candidatus Dormibacteraeota bacterium]|nr:TRAP transporter substrate-binding protein [Candidatus Dormibacteraeota bacterium]
MVRMISRRKFTRGLMAAGGVLLVSRRLPAAEFELRQFHNQPAGSPLDRRLKELWNAVKIETHGRVQVQTFPQNDHIPGGDPAALKMIVSGELDFFTLNGGNIGNIVPASNVQGLLLAFHTPAQVFGALDGDLGDYLHQEMLLKGIFSLPKGCFDNGFHQISCSTHPIRSLADLQGLKIRTPAAPIYVEAWKALGASPVVVNFDKLYETLKSGAAEAQTNPLAVVEFLKLYQVQKYESMTNHGWSGFNQLASLKVWKRLPADVQRIIERNTVKYVRLQRADLKRLNAQFRTTLAQQGMIFNTADTAGFRSRLAPYYAHWRKTVGERAWKLLEEHVGKLG